MIAALAVTLALAICTFVAGFPATDVGLWLVASSTCLILLASRREGRIAEGLDLSRPVSLYGSAYVLYYVLPYLGLWGRGELDENHAIRIALAILLGFAGWAVGVSRVKPRRETVRQ